MNSSWHRKHQWIGHDLTNDGGYVALRRAAEDREGRRQRKDVNNLLYSRRLLMMPAASDDINSHPELSVWKHNKKRR